MSHDDCAQLWYEIEQRHDLVFVVTEAFGKVWLTGEEDIQSQYKALLIARFVSDYQRYLLRTRQFGSQPLLSTWDLITIAKFVVRVTDYSPEYSMLRQRSPRGISAIARQAFTSVLRAILLRADHQESEVPEVCEAILRLLNSWPLREPEDEQVLKEFVRASVRDLQACLYDGINIHIASTSNQCPHAQWNDAHPKVAQNLRSQDKQYRTLVHNASKCLETGCQYRHRSFWELMDLELIFLVSSYQLLPCSLQIAGVQECHHLGHETKPLSALQPDLQNLSQQFHTFRGELAPRSSRSCINQYKLWLQNLQPVPYCASSHGRNCFMKDSLNLGPSSEFLEPCAMQLSNDLQLRSQMTTRSSKDIQSVVEGVRQDIANWLGPPPSSTLFGESPQSEFRLYALSCPRAHVLRYDVLYDTLNALEHDFQAGLQNLEDGDDDFEIRISCPKCETSQPSAPRLWARKIVPLTTLPVRAQSRVLEQSVQTPPPPVQPHLPSPIVIPTVLNLTTPPDKRSTRLVPQASESPSSSGHSHNISREDLASPTSKTNTDKRSQTSSTLSRFTNKLRNRNGFSSPKSSNVQTHIILSSDGDFMVAYSREIASCFSFASQSWSTASVHGEAMYCAVASSQYFALADTTFLDTSHQTWLIRVHNNISGDEINLPLTHKFKDPIRALAFSRDSRRFALSTENFIWTTDTTTFAQWQCKTFAPQHCLDMSANRFDTQVLSYTPDGAYLCLATRAIPSGDIMTLMIQDLQPTGPEVKEARKSKIEGALTSDHGLTAIAGVHLPSSIDYLICSSTNASGGPAIISRSLLPQSTARSHRPARNANHQRQGSDKFRLYAGNQKLDHKLQNAIAIGGRTADFIVASDEGQLFHVDLEHRQMRQLPKISIARAAEKGYYKSASMAATSSGIVRVASVEELTASLVEFEINAPHQREAYEVMLQPFVT